MYRDDRHPAGEIDPRSPCRPCAAIARHAPLAAGILQPRPPALHCDPQQPEADVLPLRRIDCVSAVLLGNISSFVQKLEDRLTRFVELSVVVVSPTQLVQSAV